LSTFSTLGISDDLIKGINECGIITPSEIQLRAIPFLIEKGTDFIGQAQTGTGKTAAFGLPILQKIDAKKPCIQALILCPTRELGQQIAKQLFKFTKYADKIFVEAVYGGTNLDLQIAALRRPTHIVVATPGRLIDLLERKAIDLSHVKTIVLDEADEMLSMGFKPDIDTILSQTNGTRHTWLFSATISDEIKDIIDTYMSSNPETVTVDKAEKVNKNIEHQFVECESRDKLDMLFHFLKSQGKNRGIIFCKTKINAQTLAKQLYSKNYTAEALHGDLMQSERDKVMRAFKNTKLQLLVATDMAARGIDVDNLSFVIHYQLPEQIEYYTHRSGRTARAGNTGISICFVEKKELNRLNEIERTLGIAFKKIK
jgi:ATP-dependent RNA helicase DeaD